MSTETDRIIVQPYELIVNKTEALIEGFVLQLPNIVTAIVLLLLAWLFGKVLAWIVRGMARRRNRPDLGSLVSALAKGVLYLLAVLGAAAIIFPTVNPGDIVAALGIGSVAIGFAFKDILQNLLAGILLLIRRPYHRGDQIKTGEFEGEVESIESRATMIRTYDGRRVIIPNSDVYTGAVTVNTAYEIRRDEMDIGIGYGDSPEDSRKVFLEVLRDTEGVLAEPAPEIIPWELSDSAITLRARWWAESRRADQINVRANVMMAIFNEASKRGIDLPYPTQVVLFHDQTEETDGDRTQQREGWPAGDNPPKPRRLPAEAESNN